MKTQFHPRNVFTKSWWQGQGASWYGFILSLLIWCTVLTFRPFAAGFVVAMLMLTGQAYGAARSHLKRYGYEKAEDNTRATFIPLFATLLLMTPLLGPDKKLLEMTTSDRAVMLFAAFWAFLFLKNMIVAVLAHKAYYTHVVAPAIARCKASSTAQKRS